MEHVPARLNPESPGLKGLVEAARNGEFEPVHLIARERLRFGDIWLEPGERDWRHGSSTKVPRSGSPIPLSRLW
jgi:hypothetical protein